jgi:signal transduction histidine kinase
LLVSAIVSALENALKFSSGPVRVSIEAQPEIALLAIEDDGPGVAEHEREQVFKPFYRGSDALTGRIPGHGIGLAVIARVAAAHGGVARFARREAGHGARLEMTFTRAEKPARDRS